MGDRLFRFLRSFLKRGSRDLVWLNSYFDSVPFSNSVDSVAVMNIFKLGGENETRIILSGSGADGRTKKEPAKSQQRKMCKTKLSVSITIQAVCDKKYL
jgi:hypothetical protein